MTRVEVMGLPVDSLTAGETVQRILEHVQSGSGCLQHVVLNAAKVVEAHSNPELRAAIEGCDLVNADGMSVVWASRFLGNPLPERVAGVDLMERLVAAAAQVGSSIYLLGARPEIVEEVARRLQALHPSLRIAGKQHGYWQPEEEQRVVDDIASSDAHMLFVAMPSPRKEQFLAAHKEAMAVPFVMGVGGTFDVIAGHTRRAPGWMQRAGLEWGYRLIQEPRRMFGRYLKGNTRFVSLMLHYRYGSISHTESSSSRAPR